MGHEDERVRRTKEYVLARLREELATAPRGAQARLARQLDVSGAHLSNMLSATPTRQPGEHFRRKVAELWGMTYAELEALALGEEAPQRYGHPARGRRQPVPPNLAVAAREHDWTRGLPVAVRAVVRDQARQHYDHSGHDLSPDGWRRVLTGLERAALVFVDNAHGVRSTPKRRRGDSASRRSHDA